jgi:hypothetical protein
MAITASIALSPSSTTAPTDVNAQVTVNNSAGASVTVTSIIPTAVAKTSGTPTTPTLLGICTAGYPGQNNTVPATGSAVFSFSLAPTSPQTNTYSVNPFPVGVTPLVPLAMPSSQVITVGATVFTSDGAITNATTADLTVTGFTPG